MWEDSTYVYIDTYYGTYILDYVDKSKGPSLAARRLQLLSESLEYKVYRLENRCTHVAQMLLNENNVFIDSLGNVVKIRRPNRYRVTCCPVVNIVELAYQKYGISFLLDGVVEYFVHHSPSNFIQVLLLKTGWLYYNSVSEKLPDVKRGV